jgi:hypothetical protein
VACCPSSLLPQRWWDVCSLAARAWRAPAPGFARRLRGVPGCGTLAFVLLVSWSCAAEAGLCWWPLGASLVMGCAMGSCCSSLFPLVCVPARDLPALLWSVSACVAGSALSVRVPHGFLLAFLPLPSFLSPAHLLVAHTDSCAHTMPLILGQAASPSYGNVASRRLSCHGGEEEVRATST